MNLRDMPPIGLVNPEPPEYYWEDVECPECKGTGLILKEDEGMMARVDCQKCDGTGFLVWDRRSKRFI